MGGAFGPASLGGAFGPLPFQCCRVAASQRENHVNVKGAIRRRLRWDSDINEYRVQLKQDVQPFIDAAKYRRDVEEAGGLTKNPAALVKVASRPETVVLEIKAKYGLDLFSANRQDLKLILKIVEAFYPKLKTTNKRIGR